MTAGVLLAAVGLLVWPAGVAAQRLRSLPHGDLSSSDTGRGVVARGAGLADARRMARRLPASLILPLAAAVAGLVVSGPLHAGAAAVLVATVIDLRGRARRRRLALAGLGAWERALDDASSALRAGAGPGLALRRAAHAAAAVEAAAGEGSAPGAVAAVIRHVSGNATGHARGNASGPATDTATGPATGDGAGRRGVTAILTTAAAHADLGGDVAAALSSVRSGGGFNSPAPGPAGGHSQAVAGRGADSEVGAIADELAGAWLLATRHGVVLADAVDGLRTDVASRRARAVRVDSTLAGPRATAVILTGLPGFGVLLGSGFGADPLAVLFQGTLGGVLCLAGAVFLAAGLLWTDRITGGALR